MEYGGVVARQGACQLAEGVEGKGNSRVGEESGEDREWGRTPRPIRSMAAGGRVGRWDRETSRGGTRSGGRILLDIERAKGGGRGKAPAASTNQAAVPAKRARE